MEQFPAVMVGAVVLVVAGYAALYERPALARYWRANTLAVMMADAAVIVCMCVGSALIAGVGANVSFLFRPIGIGIVGLGLLIGLWNKPSRR